jgi:glycerol-3-phosphate dehydrogenase
MMGNILPGVFPDEIANGPARTECLPVPPIADRLRGQQTELSLGVREERLVELASDEFDLLVVGGGITGCGIALDAAARGLTTALVEARDFASGTSSRSSKLIHGGLRYLRHGKFGLVREASVERRRLQELAPGLVGSLPFVLPVYGGA